MSIGGVGVSLCFVFMASGNFPETSLTVKTALTLGEFPPARTIKPNPDLDLMAASKILSFSFWAKNAVRSFKSRDTRDAMNRGGTDV